MRALVTGGAGFVGTNLINRLLDDGHRVVSLDNYSTGKKENEIHRKGVQYFDVNLVETDEYDFFMEKPDIIYHLAAIARIQPSFEHPVYTHHSNVTTTLNIMDWVREKKCPVVYAGSSSSHGDKCANPYTHSKWLGEQVVTMYNRIYNIPTAICRFYNVYGDYQLTEGAYCTVLGIFERLYGNNEPLTITGDGEQRRDFTQVDDIVDGLIRCGESMDKISGEIFELGKGKSYSINEIADAFGDYPTKYIEEKPGEMRYTLNTDTKARDVLGWNPKGDIIDYIKNNILRK